MPNTERPMGKAEQKRQGIVDTSKRQLIDKAPVEESKKMTPEQEKKAEKLEEKSGDLDEKSKVDGDIIKSQDDVTKTQQNKQDSELTDKNKKSEDENQTEKAKETEEKTEEKKKPVMKKVKKDKVNVNVSNLNLSTKYATAICKFIKRKEIEKAIADLEEVLKKKKPIPMKGEYAHKKGPGKIASGSGKYPKNATEQFIKLLKSLQGNANNHEVDNPVIVEAFANIGVRPLGKSGRWRRKRTHVKIVAQGKKDLKKKNGVKKNE